MLAHTVLPTKDARRAAEIFVAATLGCDPRNAAQHFMYALLKTAPVKSGEYVFGLLHTLNTQATTWACTLGKDDTSSFIVELRNTVYMLIYTWRNADILKQDGCILSRPDPNAEYQLTINGRYMHAHPGIKAAEAELGTELEWYFGERRELMTLNEAMRKEPLQVFD